MKVYNKIEQLIGKTPLFEVCNIQKEEGAFARVFVKLEGFNPAGSIKDRAALFMLDDFEKNGVIKEGATIIEPTSGNTGIGLSAIGVSRGYNVILTMPDTMSVERVKLLKAYGAQVVLTDGKKGMAGAIEKAKELNAKIDNSVIVSQFDNKANNMSHYLTTGPEIWEDTDGKVDLFIAGIGTGGTLSGTAKYLKEKNPSVLTIGVEPEDSPLISKGKFGAHKIQGIGANFIPNNFDKSVCDIVERVSIEDSYLYANKLAKKEGLLVGISSGAALAVAFNYAKKEENKNKIIVAILPDRGDRYLSTELFD